MPRELKWGRRTKLWVAKQISFLYLRNWIFYNNIYCQSKIRKDKV